MQLNLVEMISVPVYQPRGRSDAEAWEGAVSDWRNNHDSLQAHYWMLGAIANFVTRRYGESDVMRFAYEVGSSKSLIYELAATARAFEGKQASPILSHSHHRVAARTSDPEKAIEIAEVEQLSVRQMKQRFLGEESDVKSDPILVPTPKHSARVEYWKSHIRAKPCFRCGAKPVEFAHFKGVYSTKHSSLSNRRGDYSDWTGLPLCPACHRTAPDSIHNVGEKAFFESFGGLEFVQSWVIQRMIDWMLAWD